MSRPDITSLLDRYSRGETSNEENLRVEEWLDTYNRKDSPWESMDASARKKWLDGVWFDIESSIDQPGKVSPGKNPDQPAKIFDRPLQLTEQEATVIAMPAKNITTPVRILRWKSIASIAAILLIGFGLWWQQDTLKNFINPIKYAAIKTSSSEKTSIVLSDGSTVFLNAGSDLKYPEKFTGKTREVYLEGEAYFDIKHDDQKTFIVHTGRVKTTVLGTAFNISSRAGDTLVTVTVTRGRVSVSEGEKTLGIITPNQQISYNTENKQFTKTTVDANVAIEWKSGDLYFDDITFGEAADILSERFKVRISFANDKIKECRFSGTALSGKNIDEILKVVCTFNNASYQHLPNGNISIDGKGCR